MAVSSYLADRNLLEKIGGTTKLAQLLNRTVSAVNIDRYTALVMDKFTRRQLIYAGHEIVDLGYDTAKDLETVLDESEQKIFRLNQERPQEGLIPISDTLVTAFNTIEDLHQETALPGVPSGFLRFRCHYQWFWSFRFNHCSGKTCYGKNFLLSQYCCEYCQTTKASCSYFLV